MKNITLKRYLLFYFFLNATSSLTSGGERRLDCLEQVQAVLFCENIFNNFLEKPIERKIDTLCCSCINFDQNNSVELINQINDLKPRHLRLSWKKNTINCITTAHLAQVLFNNAVTHLTLNLDTIWRENGTSALASLLTGSHITHFALYSKKYDVFCVSALMKILPETHITYLSLRGGDITDLRQKILLEYFCKNRNIKLVF